MIIEYWHLEERKKILFWVIRNNKIIIFGKILVIRVLLSLQKRKRKTPIGGKVNVAFQYH
jgi:hypothetical protein